MEIQKLEDFGRSLSSQDVAKILGVSVTTVYSVAEEFGGVRVGKKYVFFERVFFDRLKAKVHNEKVSAPPVLPELEVSEEFIDLPLEDCHGLLT